MIWTVYLSTVNRSFFVRKTFISFFVLKIFIYFKQIKYFNVKYVNVKYAGVKYFHSFFRTIFFLNKKVNYGILFLFICNITLTQ